MTVFEGPLLQVTKAHSACLVHFKAPQDEVFEVFGDGNLRFEPDGYFGHFLDQLGFSFALPGGLTVEHFVDHDSNGPYIVFDGVNVAFEGLGGHVERAANVILLLLRLGTK